jgi:hypothetical protein
MEEWVATSSEMRPEDKHFASHKRTRLVKGLALLADISEKVVLFMSTLLNVLLLSAKGKCIKYLPPIP